MKCPVVRPRHGAVEIPSKWLTANMALVVARSLGEILLFGHGQEDQEDQESGRTWTIAGIRTDSASG
ncbi:MAG: hypothetical protein JWM76_4313 [Pseudonocardiales bacterium]|nr:hypothetical protein [Pseudonocardiales bacterium]